MNIHELRDDLSNRKITDQSFLFTCKIDSDGKLVETIMLFKDIEAFVNAGSIIVQVADMFIKTEINDL